MNSPIYCNPKTWLEGPAVEQFRRVLALPGILRGAAFPDLHPGRGVPVGAAFLAQDIIYPALIGNDIGCGMTLATTRTPARKLKIDKLLRRLGNSPEEIIQSTARECLSEEPAAPEDPLDMRGTLGHGNHFAEILAVENVLDTEAWNTIDAKQDEALLLVHAGSRAYGEKLWRDIAAKHGDDGIAPDSPDGAAYLAEHARLVEWASNNRRLVARALARLLAYDCDELLNATHNSITPVPDNCFLHRKGASAVTPGRLAVVAGTRGSFSYLVMPIGNPADYLFTIAHGAGRKWNRQSTRERVRAKHADAQSLLQTKLGTRVVCPSKELLYEEAPEAYKDVEAVIADLQDFGLARPVARLRPLVNIKP